MYQVRNGRNINTSHQAAVTVPGRQHRSHILLVLCWLNQERREVVLRVRFFVFAAIASGATGHESRANTTRNQKINKWGGGEAEKITVLVCTPLPCIQQKTDTRHVSDTWKNVGALSFVFTHLPEDKKEKRKRNKAECMF